jgi:DNA-binding GntR family transcriptional regulator
MMVRKGYRVRARPKESLKDRAYRIIKSKIVNCEFPPNAFLNELELVSEIGTSRTPIREAMSKLENERLVRILPKKGVVVTGIAYHEVDEVYQLRELLEPFIIRTWGDEIDPVKLKHFRVAMAALDESVSNARKFQLDDEFHRLIVGHSHNRFVMQVLDSVYDQTQRIRIISGNLLRRRLEDTCTEHLRIIDLLLQKRLAEAAQAMERHLRNARRAAFTSLAGVA